MQKRLFAILLGCIAIGCLTGCGSDQSAGGEAASSEPAAVKDDKVNASPGQQQLTKNPNYPGR